MADTPSASSAADLIEHPDQLTPEWLTGALSERHPGARVASVEVQEIREGTNANARIRVSYEGPSDLPEALFLKLPPLEPERRALLNSTGMGRREVHFYMHLADRVPMRVPTPYVARWNPSDGAFVLVIEDLEAAGCTLPDLVDGITFEQAASAVRDFAGLKQSASGIGQVAAQAVGKEYCRQYYGDGGKARADFTHQVTIDEHERRISDGGDGVLERKDEDCGRLSATRHP